MSLLEEEWDNTNSDARSFFYLLRDIKPYRIKIFWALALITISSALTVYSARVLGTLIQQGLIERQANIALSLGATVIGLEMLAVALTFVGRRLLAMASSRTIFDIRQKLFRKLDRLPMTYFDRNPLGRTVTRMTYDVENLESFFSGTLARLLSATISIVVVLVAMISTNLKLGLWLVLAIIPAIAATYFTRKPLRYWNSEFARRNSAINSHLNEFLNGLPVIRGFGSEAWSQKRFNETVNSHLDSAIKINVLNSWARPAVLALCQLPLLVLLYFGGKQVLMGVLDFGIFVAFVRYCERFSRPINALTNEVHTIQQAFTNAERVSRFLAADDEHRSLGSTGTFQFTEFLGEIEFQNVTMSYDNGLPVLKNVSFHIAPGSRVGLVGTTGSGKTTTLALLARLYEFQQGEVQLDGKCVRSLNRQWLRSQIGFISQDVVIFRGSLRENLKLDLDISDIKILDACKKTGLLALLNRTQRNLDSEILSQGLNLSVGERQLVALTRVLIKDPRLMVLDEATANIDPEMEKLVYEAVDSVMKNRTCLIIAHRLETLQSCEKILVFHNGEILESGSHDELVQLNGHYSQLLHNSSTSSAFYRTESAHAHLPHS